jgi:ferredoxin--NADP+ reductase
MSQMEHADLVIPDEERRLDPLSQSQLDNGELDRENVKNLEVIEELVRKEPREGREVILMRFYLSPVEIIGTDRVEAVKVQYNELAKRDDGKLITKPIDKFDTIPCGLVFRSIGYKVAPLEGVPYDVEWSWIPHEKGQVLDGRNGQPVAGLFVAGWAKRGPSGIIGTNKPDAVETVGTLLEAHGRGELPPPGAGDIAELLAQKGVRYVTYDEWKRLDAIEKERGGAEGRPRLKFVRVAEALAALED